MKSYYEWAKTFPVVSKNDVIAEADPGDVTLSGEAGEKIESCVRNRLKPIIHHPLMLGGYAEKNLPYPWKPEVDFSDSSWEGNISFGWQGEHIGKWLHAASVLGQLGGDEELIATVHDTADTLVSYQDADGYLGTYDPVSRFTGPDGEHSRTSWDVWTHRYHLYGLLTAYRYFGKVGWLEACVRIGDLLLDVFGPEGRKNLAYEGTRRGLSALTVLESIIMLYRASGEKRFLDFALYLLYESSEQRTKVLSSLVDGLGVCSVGDGKAYQFMSVLLGVVELAHRIDDPDLLYAVITAWEEIADDHLHVTGGPWSKRWKITANAECFAPPQQWSPFERVEICSTVTWIQLCMSLFGYTGEIRYFDQAERSILNHLSASVVGGSDGAYFSHPNGPAFQFSNKLHCCNSSAPRGWAMLATHAYGIREAGITINAYGAGTFRFQHPVAGTVRISQQTNFPSEGRVTIHVQSERLVDLPLFLRIPGWAMGTEVCLNGQPVESDVVAGSWLRLERTWEDKDRVVMTLPIEARTYERVCNGVPIKAYGRGPIILAGASSSYPSGDVASDPGDSSQLTSFAEAASLGENIAVWFKEE